MKLLLLILGLAFMIGCNDQGWDQQPNPNDTIPTRDTSLIDTSGTIH